MRYIIITPLKYTINDQNSYTVEQLWGLDLEANSKYFKVLNVFAPFQKNHHLKTQNGSMYTFPRDSSVTFIPFPDFKNMLDFLFKVPLVFHIINKKICKNDIVHCVGTAYIPVGIIANIILWVKRHKSYIFILDADFIGDLELRMKSEKNILYKMFSYIVRNLYLNIFIFCIKTSPLTFVIGDTLYNRYKKYGNVYKIYASWINEKDIISSIDFCKKSNKLLNKKELKLVFAANLTYKKNPNSAIEIIRLLRNKGISATLDIFGEGPMKLELEAFVIEYNLIDIVKFKGVVSYNFFNSILREYDIIIVPNLSGEQPRIIFDAMASGVIVIGSEIDSFKDIIINYKNGLLCKPNDFEKFANLIETLYFNRADMVKIMEGGVSTVKKYTIQSTHKRRAQIITETL